MADAQTSKETTGSLQKTYGTSGIITNVHVDRSHSHYDTVYCQNDGNHYADGGDSGGPVYGLDPHHGWQLYGINYSRDPQTSTTWFSPIWNIEADLGSLSVR